jgi:hypothetical protein
MGFGFNLNKKMSLGYLMEKDFKQKEADLGWNHELSLAYTFKNNDDNTTNYVDKSQDEKIDRIVRNYEEQILKLTADKTKGIGENKSKEERKRKGETEELGKGERNTDALAYENRLILDELILRQDSLEEARNHEFEQRFEIIVRTLRNDLKQSIRTNFEDYGKTQNAVLAANENKHIQPKDLRPVEHKDYVKLPIKVLDQSDIVGVETGYYVIANVYKNKKYLNAFMKSLKNQGLNAKQFYNKENGLYYVYLADFNFKKDAETAFVSNLNGKYRDEKWIMQIDNPSATVANIYED